MSKNIKFLFISFVAIAAISALSVNPSYATSSDSSCGNHNGSILASHPDGIHGVVGDPANHTGIDTVYSTSTGALQCLCEGNAGTQTEWKKVGTLSQEEIDSQTASGWLYVPNGTVWGLDPGPYLAFNSSFSCGNSPSGGNSNSNSGSNNNQSGQVLGAATMAGQVLGLAFTGNSVEILGLALAALISFVLAYKLRKN